ncbi:hypothetical protein Tco_0639642 [Tanacetum coccineum]
MVLPNIPCPKECKIMGQLLVDHALSYALTATTDVPATMFKVFNRCLTSRTSSHDQTKINILQIFHDVINRVHVDFASLLCLTPFHRLEEDYHYIKYDVPLVSVYTTRNVTIKGILILDDLLADDIRETQEYKDYAKEFVRVDVPTIQPQLIESTQGANRTPRATRTSNLVHDVKPNSSTPIPPLSDDRKRDEIHKATQLSPALLKTAKLAEEQENVAAFIDFVFLDEDDSGTSIEPESHKENPKEVDDDDEEEEKKDDKKNDDDDDNDDHDYHALVRTRRTCSSKIRNKKMQTPIPSPLRFPRKDLSSDKAIAEELTVSVSPTPATLFQRRAKLISKKYSHILVALRRQGFMIKQMEKKYVTNREFQDIKERVDKVLHDIVPKIASNATNDLIDDNLPRVVADAMKTDLQDQVVDLELWDVIKRKFENSSAAVSSCRDDAFHKCDHDENQGDDGSPEGEKSAKRHKTSKSSKSAKGSLSKQNLNEPPRYLYNKDLIFLKYVNSEERKYVLLLHKIHDVPFPKEDLEEKMNRWVRKEFETFNDEAQLENEKLDILSEADFKYLNKNDIEDMYYLLLNKKVNYCKNKLLNSLITFIRTCDPYYIIDKPTTGLIYLNIKEEKIVMNLVEIVKFYDATLERVLKEVKLKIFEIEFLKKASLLGESDLDIMKAYKIEITKCLRHHQ